MKPKLLLFILHVSLGMSLSTSPVLSQVNMFRGNAEHNLNSVSNSDLLFAEAAWKFKEGSPIRSTVVCDKQSAYFGSSQGIFYSIQKTTGKVQWTYRTGAAIESSAAILNNDLFFSDNKQSLYSLEAATGKLNWKFDFGISRKYDWGFDYFYSSPTIINSQLVIGAKDGFVYNIDAVSGRLKWKFKTEGIVRSTAAVSAGLVYFGDTDGILYAVDLSSGKEQWRFFTYGHELKNEDFGFDRRAIISSPVIANDKLIVGCRDGFFYGINKTTGKEIWRVDHKVSWVISSIAVKDSIAVTGTSDGRFVQAVNINTGKEIWKCPTISIVWSSAQICGNKVYIGSQEGILYCFNLYTGKKMNGFQADGKIFSSPVISDSLLFFATDAGYLYALKPSVYSFPSVSSTRRYVFWEQGVNIYFHYGNDIRVRDYLTYNKYQLLHAKELEELLAKTDSAAGSVIVFASNYFPADILKDHKQSLLRKYLDNGGRIVVLGNNPATYKLNDEKQVQGLDFFMADSVLDIKYGLYNDLRSMGGLQPAYPTGEGRKWGLVNGWTGFLPVEPAAVDIILGKDENGKASAWLKKYSTLKGSGFIQAWVDPDYIEDISIVPKLAEYGWE